MILLNKKILVLFFATLLMQACSKVDDYVLGKDNTPKPSALEPIKTKINIVENWSIPVGKATKLHAYLKLKPVIKGNVIYIVDTAGVVQAINIKNGHIIWSKRLNEAAVSGPTVANGYVVIGTDEANIILLKQSDGQELWRAKVSSDALSKSLIARGRVIVKTIDGNLYAFDLKTGEKLWVADHGAPSLVLKASSSPIVLDKLVLVGFSDGKLDAIDIDSGHGVWQRSIAYASGSSDVERLVDIDADPIVRDGIIYLASYQGYVGALSLSNGQFIWNKPASTYKNLAIDSNTIYMTDSDDILWAFDKHNGQVRWKQVSLKARGLSEPVLMGSRLFVGDKTGYLHGISTQNGEMIARTELSGAVDISPAVSGNHLYVLTANGKLNRLAVSK
jgi:outer membrane protein assembly factor BamB